MMNNISIYKAAFDTTSDRDIPFDLFLDNIRDGHWQDHVLPIRAMKDKTQRDEAKKKVPCVTIAGKFSKRTDDCLSQHSGFIGIDVDGIEDVNRFKELLSQDMYCYSAFTSISGQGVCLIFKVDAAKHRLAFQGICEYIYTKYGYPCDPTSINESRARFVSYDPDIYVAPSRVPTFTLYPKSKPPKKIDKSIYAPDDFAMVLNTLIERRLNICEGYHEWIRVAFGLVHQFGDSGRDYFHTISQFSSKYDSTKTDRQWDACVRHRGSSEATIAMFYYYCKQAGVEIYSERTRTIAYSASQGKKVGLSVEQVVENLRKFEDIYSPDNSPGSVEDIVRQVMNNDIELNDDTIIDQVELYIRQNYELRRNAITRYIETKGDSIKQKDFNSIYIKAKKIFSNINYELVDRLINSDFVSDYNPFMEFFETHKEVKSTGHIDKLFSSIKNRDPRYLAYFGKKWMVGLISAAHGVHSPLMLVLLGEKQGTGKTEFFRRMLPDQLNPYYAESKLDAGKDDEILMTQKWMIMDDEMGGKSKKESTRLKELTSKHTFSLREPYGRNNVDLRRLAVLCGTTNDDQILSDPTGNRRTIPIIVDDIDKDIYNSVDKTALIMEAYHLYRSGFEWRVISNEDIAYLRQDEEMFEVTESESELISKYYEVPGANVPYVLMTSTDIKVEIEKDTQQRLSISRLGKYMKKLGFEQKSIRHNGSTSVGRYYLVVKKDRGQQPIEHPDEPLEDLPF